MVLNALGETVRQCWLAIPDHFPHTELDEFIIMPNHVHGLIWIVDDIAAENAENVRAIVGAKGFSPLRLLPHSPLRQPPDEHPRGTSKTIGAIVRGLKIGVTKWARQHTGVHTVWQRNYYEHIIRNERASAAIRQYIVETPCAGTWTAATPTPPVPIRRRGTSGECCAHMLRARQHRYDSTGRTNHDPR